MDFDKEFKCRPRKAKITYRIETNKKINLFKSLIVVLKGRRLLLVLRSHRGLRIYFKVVIFLIFSHPKCETESISRKYSMDRKQTKHGIGLAFFFFF
jgi:hypothetical protein